MIKENFDLHLNEQLLKHMCFINILYYCINYIILLYIFDEFV